MRKNNLHLPLNMCCLIVGKSNCGKNTLLLNLLLEPWLDYNRLHVYVYLHQFEYRVIREGFEHGLSKRQIANFICSTGNVKRF